MPLRQPQRPECPCRAVKDDKFVCEVGPGFWPATTSPSSAQTLLLNQAFRDCMMRIADFCALFQDVRHDLV